MGNIQVTAQQFAGSFLATGSITVTVSPAIPSCSVNASPPGPITAGAAVQITASCTNSPSTYAWTANGVAIPATGPSFTANPQVTTTYAVVATNGSGSGGSSVTVIVNPAPPTCSPTSSVSGPVNPGTPVTLTANCTGGPTSYSWTLNGVVVGTGPTLPINAPNATATYFVTATNAGGTSAPQPVTVQVNAIQVPNCSPTSSVSGPVNPGTPVTLTANCTGAPTSYSWTLNGLVVGTGPTLPINAPNATATYFVTATNAGGASAPQPVTVQVNAIPVPTCSATQTPAGVVAPGTPVTLQATCTNSPTTYNWTLSGTVVGTTATLAITAPSATTTYMLTAGNTTGVSAPTFVTVQVGSVALPTCAPTQSPAGVVNPGSPITLQANCTNNPQQITWTQNGTVVGSGATLPLNAPNATATYTVTATNAAGTSPPQTVTVQVVSIPVPTCSPTQSPPGQVNPGTPITLQSNCTNNPTTFTWTANGIVVGSGPTLSLNTPSTTTTYSIVATNATGSSLPQAITVQVAAPPAATIVNVSGNPPPADPGSSVPLVVGVTDGQGGPVTNAQFAPPQVTGGSGTVSLATPNPPDGLYRFNFQLGTGDEARQVRICLLNVPTQCASFTVTTKAMAIVEPAKDIIAPQAVTAVTTPTIQINNIRQRLDQVRLQQSAVSVQSLRVSMDGQPLPALNAFSLVPTDNTGKAVAGGGAAADDPFPHWGVFVNGDVTIGKQSSVQTESVTQTGFKLTSKGITVGSDYRFDNNSVLGAAVGFLRADTDLNESMGTQDAKGYSFSVYGSYAPVPAAYIDLIFNAGHNTYDSQRRQSTSGDPATSNTSGDQWGVALSFGYNFTRGAVTAVPYARIEYIDAKVNGFTESGAPGEALTVSEQHVTATTISLGGQASYAISTEWGVVIPYGRIEFQHIAQSSTQDVYAGIAGTLFPATVVPTLGQDKSFGNFAVGVSGFFAHSISCYFNYEQLFGQETYRQQRYTLGVRYNF